MSALAGAIASGSLPNLVELELYSNRIGDEGMKAFAAASGSLPSLKTLVLDKFVIRDGNDTGLDLSARILNDTDMKIIAHLFANGSLGALQELYLNYNDFGDAGMAALAGAIASGSLGKLEFLAVAGNQIGYAGMSAFAGAIASGSLANLEQMSLFENQIGDAGMIEFSRAIASGSLASLKKRMVLDVEKNLLHYTEAVHYTEVGLGLGG